MAISLRKVKLSDKKYFAKWWNDSDLRKLTSGRPGPISDKEVEKYFSAMINDKNDHDFMVVLVKKPIGHISLARRSNNWYETQIIISEKEYWNKGYGTEAIKLLIRKAKRMKVSKIYLEVRPDNLRAIRAYEKCGFFEAGFKKYPKNKFLPRTLRMELIFSPQPSKRIVNYLETIRKDLGKFFGIKIKPAHLFLLRSRKQINQLRQQKTESWIVGWIKNNTIYILSPDVFATESSHKDVNEFWKVLKHEYAHIAIEQFCGHRLENPKWLIEGSCCYLAEQAKDQPMKEELLAIFKNHLNAREIYVIGYFWVKFLIEKFGKDKFIKLLKRISDKSDKNDFKEAFYGAYKFHYSKEDFGKLL